MTSGGFLGPRGRGGAGGWGGALCGVGRQHEGGGEGVGGEEDGGGGLVSASLHQLQPVGEADQRYVRQTVVEALHFHLDGLLLTVHLYLAGEADGHCHWGGGRGGRRPPQVPPPHCGKVPVEGPSGGEGGGAPRLL